MITAPPGPRGGLEVHGSLWVLAAGVRAGGLAADGLVAALVREGARYPFATTSFADWAWTQGLL